MYIPAAFLQTDQPKLFDFIDAHSFGTLVTYGDGGPFASHLPFWLDRDWGASGALLTHVARANPQSAHALGDSALAIFTGPHCYISPTWYGARAAVPTWNYTAVHVYGRLEIVDESTLFGLLERLVAEYEPQEPDSWSIADEQPTVQRLAHQIVALRLSIERIEGKWKLSQNRPLEQRRRVVDALHRRGDHASVQIAELMAGEIANDAGPIVE